MKRKLIPGLVVFGVFALLAWNMRVSYAEPNVVPITASYSIAWYTVDGGGGMNLTSGAYTLSGTIGQYDAGAQSGTGYQLNSGFWINIGGYTLYLPLIVR